MSLIVGRQPILDQNGVTFGYELLYRGDVDHAFDSLHEDEATSHVINNSFYNTEFGSLTSGKKSFINFTTQLILDEMWRVLPKQQVVIEFLENIKPTAEIITAAEMIKSQGYTLALDDFEYAPELEPLIELADIIKVDFTISDMHTVEQLAKTYLPQGKILLAEKVETLKEFKASRDWGYTLFQGYFFAEPEIIESEQIPESKASKLQLMQKIHKQDIDFGELVDVLKTDPSLTMKLLKYINSVSMGIRHEITNLRQALALIGLVNFKKWATVLTMASISDDKPKELMKLSLLRGRFCEILSEELGLEDQSSEYFLTGIFSLMDAAFNKPMETIVADLPLSDEIIDTLLGNETKIQNVLKLSQLLETDGEIDDQLRLLNNKISQSKLFDANRDAITWADEILRL
ncbi:MAG: HDOD domain-containing protein [Candidatus Marinimicrobia bacterium]|nr:HDOD domain-containing protein [Candidatus Neomarinimicrobiota bacterium]